MKVYALTNAGASYGEQIDDIFCYGVYSTAEKAREALKKAIEEIKENWVETDIVEDEKGINVRESNDTCTLKANENIEMFKIEEIEVDECFNN